MMGMDMLMMLTDGTLQVEMMVFQQEAMVLR